MPYAPMLRALIAILVLAIALVSSGCGDGDSDARSEGSALTQPSATSSTTTAKTDTDTAPATPTTNPNPSDRSPVPDFVLHGKSSDGDRVSVAGTVVGDPVPASQAGLDADVLGSCGTQPERAYALRVDLTGTVVSSLPIRVLLASIGDPMLGAGSDSQYAKTIVVADDGSESCTPSVDLSELRPDRPTSATIWLVLYDAITPDDPTPSRATLAQTFIIGPPALVTTSGPMLFAPPTGRRVKRCAQGYAIALLGGKVARDGSGPAGPGGRCDGGR